MARIGWSHLMVRRAAVRSDGAAQMAFATADGGSFESEQKMLDDLGAAGWELVWVREESAGAELVYYFKRPRA